MDSRKLNDWLQVVGLFAVVGSLVFVGLQMQQDQEIALSQAYQARAETSMLGLLAILESDTALSATTKANSGEINQLTPTESQALFLLNAIQFIQWENVHYQYQRGFVSQEHWETQLDMMRTQLPEDGLRLLYRNSPGYWRASFRAVIEQIYKEIDG